MGAPGVRRALRDYAAPVAYGQAQSRRSRLHIV
jgi:hypothetical protein